MKTLFDAVTRVSNIWRLIAFTLAIALLLVLALKPNEFFRFAAKLPPALAVAVFIAAVVALIVLAAFRSRRNVPTGAWVVAILMLCMALAIAVAPYYREWRAVYRVRVVVLDLQHQPADNALVTSSVGGEPQKIDGGWRFEIPAANRPSDGRVTFYARVPSAFQSGETVLQLGDDFAPTSTIMLSALVSVSVKGIVQDRSGRLLEGATVGVIGYEEEAKKTGPDGNFVLSVHKADGQQVELYAKKQGYKSTTQWFPAGDAPATLVLERD